MYHYDTNLTRSDGTPCNSSLKGTSLPFKVQVCKPDSLLVSCLQPTSRYFRDGWLQKTNSMVLPSMSQGSPNTGTVGIREGFVRRMTVCVCVCVRVCVWGGGGGGEGC